MLLKRQEYKLQDKVVLGRAIFVPPFKANSALEKEARFIYVQHGRSKLNVPKASLDIVSKDSFIMKCDKFVNNWLENDHQEPSEVLVFQFHPEILHDIYQSELPFDFKQKVNSAPNPAIKLGQSKMLHSFMEGIREYLDKPELISKEFLKLKIRELIMIILNQDEEGEVKNILNGLFDANEYEFSDIIHSNLYQDLNAEDLAFLCNMSLSSFKRKFSEVFHQSPGKYITSKRLEKAGELLTNLELSVSEVAFEVGYNDLGYFSKAFLKEYQVSPTNFRKNL